MEVVEVAESALWLVQQPAVVWTTSWTVPNEGGCFSWRGQGMGTKRNLELCWFGDIYLVGLVVGGDVEWTRQHAPISHGRALITLWRGMSQSCPVD